MWFSFVLVNFCFSQLKLIYKDIFLTNNTNKVYFLFNTYTLLPKVLGHPFLMNRFEYFNNFQEYKS